VVRGQDGTSATSFDAGTKIELRVTAAALHESVSVAVDDLVDSAPGALDTLNELAAALGDDANFSTTVTNSIATKVPLAGGTMTGNLTAPNLSITSTNWFGFGDYGERITGSNAAGTLTFLTDATTALQLDSSQGATFSGAVTVGADDTGHDVKFFGATAGSYMLWDESADDLILGGAARLGVGDTPDSTLHVKDTVQAVNTWTSLTDAVADASFRFFGSSHANEYGIFMGYANSSNDAQGIQASRTSGAAAFPLLLNPFGGEVGIGLTATTAPLTVKSDSTSSSDSGITLQGNGNTNAIFKVGEKSTDGARLHMYDGGTEKIAFYTDGTANHISAGNLGIGVSPHASSKLHVYGDTWLDSAGTTNRSLYFRNQSTDSTGGAVKSDQTLSLWSGNGSGAPVQRVTIDTSGDATFAGNLDVDGSAGIYQRNSSGGSIVLDDTDTADASTPMVYLRNAAGQLTLGRSNRNASTGLTTSSTDSLTISSAGNATFAGTITATASGANSSIYALDLSRSGSGSSPDIWSNSNNLVLGTSASNAVLTLLNSDATFAGTVTSETTTGDATFVAYRNQTSLVNEADGSNLIGAYLFKSSDTSGTEPHYAGIGGFSNKFGQMELQFFTSRDRWEADPRVPTLTLDKDKDATFAGGATFAGDVTVSGGILNLGTANTSSAHINSYELMTLNIDTDNDDTDRYFKWSKNGSSGSGTELMRLDESGDATFTGHIELADSKYLKLGADADFIIYHDGTSNYVQAAKQDSDIIFRGNDGGTGVNMLTLDTSAYGDATFSGHAILGGKITVGTTLDGVGAPAAGTGVLGATSAYGAILTGQGSTSDVTITNDAGNTVLLVPTGTRHVQVPYGDITTQGLTVTGATDTTEELARFQNSAGSNELVISQEGTSGYAIKSSVDLRLHADADNDTSAGGSNIKMYTDASERMRITNGGDVTIGSGDNVGTAGTLDLSVGSTNYTGGLTLWSPSQSAHSVSFGDGYTGTNRYRGFLQYSHIDDSLAFGTTSTEKARIDSSGNVGIGTTVPAGTLDLGNATGGKSIVWGGTSADAHYTSIWSEYGTASLILGAGLKPPPAAAGFKVPYTGTYGYAAIELDSWSDDGMKFYVGPDASVTKDADITPTEVMRIATNGRVGIGTTSPGSLLHLSAAASPTLRIVDTTNDCTLLAYAQDSEAIIGTYSNHDLGIFANSARAMTIRADGYVGIGTNSIDSRLHVESGGATELTIEGDGQGYINAGLVFKANNSTSYRGLGVFMHDAGADVEWYAGTPYAAADTYIIARKASLTSHDNSMAQTANQLVSVNSSGTLTAHSGYLQVGGSVSSYGRIEAYGSSGAYLDLSHAVNHSGDYDSRFINDGTNTQLTSKTGFIDINPQAERTYLRHSGSVVLETTAEGFRCRDTSGSEAALTFGSSANATLGSVVASTSGGEMQFYSYIHGAAFAFRGEDGDGTVNSVIWADPDSDVWLYYDGGWKFRTASDGVLINGSISYNSDRRLKKDISPISGALDAVMSLKGVNYTLIDSDTKHIGFIAQDIQADAPSWLTERVVVESSSNDETAKRRGIIRDDESVEMLALKYTEMVALLTEAMKEQQTQIEALTKRIKELEDK